MPHVNKITKGVSDPVSGFGARGNQSPTSPQYEGHPVISNLANGRPWHASTSHQTRSNKAANRMGGITGQPPWPWGPRVAWQVRRRVPSPSPPLELAIQHPAPPRVLAQARAAANQSPGQLTTRCNQCTTHPLRYNTASCMFVSRQGLSLGERRPNYISGTSGTSLPLITRIRKELKVTSTEWKGGRYPDSFGAWVKEKRGRREQKQGKRNRRMGKTGKQVIGKLQAR